MDAEEMFFSVIFLSARLAMSSEFKCSAKYVEDVLAFFFTRKTSPWRKLREIYRVRNVKVQKIKMFHSHQYSRVYSTFSTLILYSREY